MKLLCIGEMVIDFLPGKEDGSYLRKAGGGPANVAIAASRLGCDVGFCGMMGNDDFGHFLLDTLKENNVFPLVEQLTEEATTTMAFVTLDEKGDRSFTFARKPGADMFLDKSHLEHPFFYEADLLYAGSCSLSAGKSAITNKYALEKAHTLGKMVCFDVNYRALLWNNDRQAARNKVSAILPSVDILKVAEEELDFAGGESCLKETMSKNNISVVLVTLGSRGVCCYFREHRICLSGLPVNCIDATGAGDAFFGGFLSVLLKESISSVSSLSIPVLEKALQVGNIAGSLCVQKKGSLESLPYESEIALRQKEVYPCIT